MVTLSIGDHGHQISYGRIFADFDAERSSFTCTRSRRIDITIPLPVLMHISEQFAHDMSTIIKHL